MNRPLHDPSEHPETAKFLQFYAGAKTQGLADVKFFAKDTSETKLDQFFLEVNQALSADVVQDPCVT